MTSLVIGIALTLYFSKKLPDLLSKAIDIKTIKYFNDMMHLSPNIILLLNNKKEIIYNNVCANKSFSALGDINKIKLWDLFDSTYHKKIQDILLKCQLNTTYKSRDILQLNTITKDNDLLSLTFRVSITQYIENQKRFFFVSMVDISEWYKVEKKLESVNNNLLQTSNYLATILNNMNDAVFTINAAGIVDATNDACCRMFGYDKMAIKRLHISNLIPGYLLTSSIGPNGDIETLNNTVHYKVCAQEALSAQKSDKEYFPIAFSISKVNFNNETYYCCIVRDLTAQHNYEKSLIAAQQALTNQNNKLKQVNQDLELFNYIASHDLREPLRSIHGYCELIRMRHGIHFDSKDHKYFDYIFSSVNKMRDLILGIRDFSNICEQPDLMTDINSLALIETALKKLKENYTDLSIEFNIINWHNTLGYEYFIDLLFTNILTNAIKYNNKKTIKIKLDSFENSDSVVFCITDNGMGLNKKDHQKVFELFYRLHNKDEISGCGIGLALCKRIMDIHKGEIWVESKKGHGASFFMCFPKKFKNLNKVAA